MHGTKFSLTLNIINKSRGETCYNLYKNDKPWSLMIVPVDCNDMATRWLALLHICMLACSKPQGGDNSLCQHQFCLAYDRLAACSCRVKILL